MNQTPDPRFHLQQPVDALYTNSPRRLAFRAQTVDEFRAWQIALRQQVAHLIGIAGRIPPPVRAEKLQTVDRGAYSEEKWTLDVGDTLAPMYLLIPKTAPPYRPVLVFHGHMPSIQYALGNYPNAQEAQARLAIDNNYAQALALAGYFVCAVEQRGFGERISDQLGGVDDCQTSCRHLSFEYLMQGRVMLGERCWDGLCALNFLAARDDLVPGVMGCTGNSGGGTITLWLSALDERITVVVPSCYLCSFKRSILGVRHCECNYVPGILQYAEMGDLAALIAPRPFRAIAGERDPIFPIDGVREQFETVQRAYDLLGAGDRCSLTVHPGEHAYNHAMSHEWFGQWLGV
ncbi:MAG: acetylxylan esterase [Anaerolineae bacterium]|nr:acetylxylan esterase [Anaerolineae bacterium]